MRGQLIIGKVITTTDPEALGRVQVQLMAYQGTVQVWLRMMVPYASKTAGFVFLPEVDDEVLILRGADDSVDGMFVLGALYNGANVPTYTDADGKNVTKTIQTRSGSSLTFSDKEGEVGIELKTKGGAVLTMTDRADTKGFAIANGDGTVTGTLDMNGVSITVANAKGVTMSAEGAVTVNAKQDVTVKSAAGVNVEAGTNVSAKGSVNVSLEAGAALVVKGGAKVSVEAPIVEVKGSMVTIN